MLYAICCIISCRYVPVYLIALLFKIPYSFFFFFFFLLLSHVSAFILSQPLLRHFRMQTFTDPCVCPSRCSHRRVFPPLLSSGPEVHQRGRWAQPQQGGARDVPGPAAGTTLCIYYPNRLVMWKESVFNLDLLVYYLYDHFYLDKNGCFDS